MTSRLATVMTQNFREPAALMALARGILGACSSLRARCLLGMLSSLPSRPPSQAQPVCWKQKQDSVLLFGIHAHCGRILACFLLPKKQKPPMGISAVSMG